MSTKAKGVPVTLRALLQRINRKLAPEGRQLKKTRGTRWRGDLGDYYAIDVRRNILTAQHVDPEAWGREMGVLQPWETVADE
jgi:hypothetical protein